MAAEDCAGTGALVGEDGARTKPTPATAAIPSRIGRGRRLVITALTACFLAALLPSPCSAAAEKETISVHVKRIGLDAPLVSSDEVDPSWRNKRGYQIENDDSEWKYPLGREDRHEEGGEWARRTPYRRNGTETLIIYYGTRTIFGPSRIDLNDIACKGDEISVSFNEHYVTAYEGIPIFGREKTQYDVEGFIPGIVIAFGKKVDKHFFVTVNSTDSGTISFPWFLSYRRYLDFLEEADDFSITCD